MALKESFEALRVDIKFNALSSPTQIGRHEFYSNTSETNMLSAWQAGSYDKQSQTPCSDQQQLLPQLHVYREQVDQETHL